MPAERPFSREERDELAENDSRDKSRKVITTPTSASDGGYAYHDPDGEDHPRCNTGGPDTEFVEMTVDEAKRRNKSPCGFCDRLSDS